MRPCSPLHSVLSEFVSETGSEKVSRIEILSDGSAGEISWIASGIFDAEGLAADSVGNLFVSGVNSVFKVANGVVTTFVSGFNDPEGLAADRHR